MTRDERDYLLKIINTQSAMLEAHAQRNMNKFVLLQKELEQQQKSPFKDFMHDTNNRKTDMVKRIENLLTEIHSVVKELKTT